ncbi:hypothetical protein [Flavobacterium sp.]|uniref:hypothetical protein n=1 Tax=Flavobacterium sp. TaxID=239 RepID=UPI003753DD3B
MKNPITLFINWIKKQFRKKEFNKRQDIYDDVINKLKPALEEKSKKQQDLIKIIINNFAKDTGNGYGSEFIPTKQKNNMHVLQIIDHKYGEKMRELDVRLTYDLRLVCI